MRTFIAIDLPTQIRSQIHQQQQSLSRVLNDPPIRWVKPESIHLTLKFLGEITPQKKQQIEDALPGEASPFPAHDVLVRGLGCFPNSNRPRVVWIGLEDPSAVLTDLQLHLVRWLDHLGFEPEKRAFSPHLTIGRIHRRVKNRHRREIGDQIRGYRVPTLGDFTVGAVHLFKSDLQPTGAVYTRLATAKLRGSP